MMVIYYLQSSLQIYSVSSGSFLNYKNPVTRSSFFLTQVQWQQNPLCLAIINKVPFSSPTQYMHIILACQEDSSICFFEIDGTPRVTSLTHFSRLQVSPVLPLSEYLLLNHLLKFHTRVCTAGWPPGGLASLTCASGLRPDPHC